MHIAGGGFCVLIPDVPGRDRTVSAAPFEHTLRERPGNVCEQQDRLTRSGAMAVFRANPPAHAVEQQRKAAPLLVQPALERPEKRHLCTATNRSLRDQSLSSAPSLAVPSIASRIWRLWKFYRPFDF